ncbi:MAG: glycosyltransferase 87 family protein [Candidatus Aureabacteria bacterium]|nr:glycosyltransferase 87 family protein [Candidatus Auribacterota bacterium]
MAFHNYTGVDGANFFSYYSQYAFGMPSGRCHYFSASFSVLAIPHLLSCLCDIPLTTCAKCIHALSWIACSYIVVTIFHNRRTGSSPWWFIMLAFNPVAMFAIHYHVQSDATVLFLMITGLALYNAKGAPSKILAGMSWAVAVSIKAFPLLLLPLFIFDRSSRTRDKAIFYMSVALFFIIPEIPWLCTIGWAKTYADAIGHSYVCRFGLNRIAMAAQGEGLYAWFVRRLFTSADFSFQWIAIVLVLVAGFLVLFRKITLFRSMGLYFALLLLFSVKNAPQYFIFVIPFAVLAKRKGALIFANAAYAIILVFFYLLDEEMNGSYCLLRVLNFMSISPGALVFWDRLKEPISLYVWGYLYLIASFLFVWIYLPAQGGRQNAGALSREISLTFRRLFCGALLLLWGLSFFSMRFAGNPFSYPDNGFPEAVNCNTMLEPPSTLNWYGGRGEYELQFTGMRPGDAVRVSGDSYFLIRLANHTLGPYRGDGNKLYSFWWGISYPLTYEALRESGFKVTIINYLCSIRGINTITARLIGQGRDWDPYGHMLDGKVKVTRCRIDGVDYGVELGQRTGWLDSVWLSIRPKNFQFKGASYINIFTIILLYIIVFFAVVGGRLKMGKGER